MKNRFLTVFLTVAMLLSSAVCLVSVNADATTEREYLSRIDFDTYNEFTAVSASDLPYSLTYQVVGTDDKNITVPYHYNQSESDTGRLNVKAPFTSQALDTEKTLVVEGNYRVTGDARFYITLKCANLSNNFVNLFLVRLNQICDFTGTGNKDGVAINSGVWYNIKVVIHLDSMTKDLYINGDLALANQAFVPEADQTKTIKVDEVYAMNCAKGGNGSNVEMDDFAMYYTTEKFDKTIYLAKEDFSSMEEGKNLNSSFSQKPADYTIMVEGEEHYLRNYQKTSTGAGPALKLPSTTEQRVVVLEEDIRFSNSESSSATFTIQVDMMNGSTQQNFTNLIKIQPSNTEAFWLFDHATARNTAIQITPKEAWEYNKWYNFRFEIDCINGTYEFIVDGESYGSGTLYSNNCTVYQRFFVYKSNNVDSSTGNAYVDVDNVKAYYLPDEEVAYTLNGVTCTAEKDTKVSLKQKNKVLAYVRVEDGEAVTYTTNTSVTIHEGMKITAYYLDFTTSEDASVRLDIPTGLRFTSTVSKADYDALKSDEHVTNVYLGTIITKTEFVRQVGTFTKEALKNAITDVTPCVDVATTADQWYASDDTTITFTGSLVNISESNYNTSFSGIGYIRVKLDTGYTLTSYAVTDTTSDGCKVATVAKETLEKKGISEAEKKKLNVYADKYIPTNKDIYSEKLKGLDVLAIGDSLFQGDTLEEKYQWINLMGEKCQWNLTNLGRNGSSISYTEGQSRASIYNRLMNEASFKFDGNAEDVDMILLEAGFNDYGGSGCLAPLGTTDSTDPSTFLGAWNAVVSILKERYPNAKIVFITPWVLSGSNTSRTDGVSYADYTTSINRLYEANYKTDSRVYLIDAGDSAVSGIFMDDATWRTTYSLGDRFHLNEAGMRIMEENMYPYISQIMNGGQAQ